MATTAEVANDLVALCRKGKSLEAIDKYYSDNIVSVESTSSPEMPKEMKGFKTVRGKTEWWLANHQVNSEEINGPFIGEKQFAVEFKSDVTQKVSGKRMKMEEMALYTVESGKIVHEHFFYNPGA